MKVCKLQDCKKDISSLPAKSEFCSNAHKMQFYRSKGKEQVKEASKKVVVEKITSTITNIPEEELNYFYRGKEGKLRLAYDEVHAQFFNSGPVIYTEKERLEIVKKKTEGLSVKLK